ncbi:hypothetical protein QFC19_008223 [Naganishia cerealis]|uniref:Uncharacterized protein n=1 Tax=Naganishia cerealis TaxID=610337 RepID=A0ACC2V4F8_9TREE|nr:hypothetical protein QFC19_008223 [Naganishia cerealis]
MRSNRIPPSKRRRLRQRARARLKTLAPRKRERLHRRRHSPERSRAARKEDRYEGVGEMDWEFDEEAVDMMEVDGSEGMEWAEVEKMVGVEEFADLVDEIATLEEIGIVEKSVEDWSHDDADDSQSIIDISMEIEVSTEVDFVGSFLEELTLQEADLFLTIDPLPLSTPATPPPAYAPLLPCQEFTLPALLSVRDSPVNTWMQETDGAKLEENEGYRLAMAMAMEDERQERMKVEAALPSSAKPARVARSKPADRLRHRTPLSTMISFQQPTDLANLFTPAPAAPLGSVSKDVEEENAINEDDGKRKVGIEEEELDFPGSGREKRARREEPEDAGGKFVQHDEPPWVRDQREMAKMLAESKVAVEKDNVTHPDWEKNVTLITLWDDE